MKEVLFEAKDLCKNFGNNAALKKVNMKINCGEIIGLVGENGAGKSTLLKIIMGVQPQSSGEMFLSGKPYAPKTPKEANINGVGMVFQEQSLTINLTVGQNIFFGHEKPFSRFGFINYRKMYAEAKHVLDEVELTDIKPEKVVMEYDFATRQMIEIAKVINCAYSSEKQHALILLDEPTSVLSEDEVQKLYKQMRRLADAGHSVIFVSHRLNEIMEVTDRIYVFRDAANAGEFVTDQVKESDLYQAMVGKSHIGEFYKTELQKDPQEEVVLEAEGLSLFGEFKDVSFQLHKGEILGICGVVGSGKEELCYVLDGDMKATAGSLRINGEACSFSKPADALKKGLIMIPQERNSEGVFGMLSITDNVAAASMKNLSKAGFVSLKALQSQAEGWIEKLRVRAENSRTEVSSLSGGNAQKVVFAKALASQCGIIILNHPTRGVDVGAKAEIYQLIREIVAEGCSVILLGDTLDECLGLSNRVLVMKDGLISGEFDAAVNNKPSHLDILQCMM